MAIKSIKYKNNTFDISYELLNQENKNTILFLHGWGSNKELMQNGFKNILKDFKHIYIDMPGFGQSNNNMVLNTQDYSNIVKLFLEYFTNINAIVGHSFGGKVATLLEPKNLILLSSAGIIEEKSAKTLLTIRMAKIFNKFGLGKVTKLLRSKDVNMMSENMYETFKNVVDEDFSNQFKNYKKNCCILWGNYDTATTLSSGKKINSLIINSKFTSFNGDHYFFLDKKYTQDIQKVIKQCII
jgi:surfactin synthase thioesterase subunit